MNCHMNLNIKDCFEIMWVNSFEYRLFGCKFYYLNPYLDVFRNMYFKDKVAVPPKCFIFKAR